jgi:succinate dehydrogenase / fumarate reductase, membrane anchor subunit
MMRSETPLARVRGLGSAGHGAGDWWMVRVNSVTTLALSVWLLVSLLRLPVADHATVTGWMQSPINAVLMLLMIVSTFWHIKYGVREVIDDYVHEDGWRVVSLGLLYITIVGMGSLAAFAVLKIAFGGAA